MKTQDRNSLKKVSKLFRAIAHPVRLRILLSIDSGEMCVCHLEAILKLRQAYISQHLMALRAVGLLVTYKEGRFVYYRLRDVRLIELVRQAASIAGVDEADIQSLQAAARQATCPCPQCMSEAESASEMA